MERLKKLDLNICLEAIRTQKDSPEDKLRVLIEGVLLKLTSNRLKTYLNGITCCHCGVIGEYFAAERQNKGDSWHLNLYGIKDGQEILMTSDHIQPKSKDGCDDLKNRQTLCYPCNQLKADLLYNEKAEDVLKIISEEVSHLRWLLSLTTHKEATKEINKIVAYKNGKIGNLRKALGLPTNKDK